MTTYHSSLWAHHNSAFALNVFLVTVLLSSASCLYLSFLSLSSLLTCFSLLLYHIKSSRLKVLRILVNRVGSLSSVGQATWWSGRVLALTLVSIPLGTFQAHLPLTLSPQMDPGPCLYPFSFSISVGQIMLLLSLISIRSMMSQRLMTCRENSQVFEAIYYE